MYHGLANKAIIVYRETKMYIRIVQLKGFLHNALQYNGRFISSKKNGNFSFLACVTYAIFDP